jgi:hypothetical protein
VRAGGGGRQRGGGRGAQRAGRRRHRRRRRRAAGRRPALLGVRGGGGAGAGRAPAHAHAARRDGAPGGGARPAGAACPGHVAGGPCAAAAPAGAVWASARAELRPGSWLPAQAAWFLALPASAPAPRQCCCCSRLCTLACTSALALQAALLSHPALASCAPPASPCTRPSLPDDYETHRKSKSLWMAELRSAAPRPAGVSWLALPFPPQPPAPCRLPHSIPTLAARHPARRRSRLPLTTRLPPRPSCCSAIPTRLASTPPLPQAAGTAGPLRSGSAAR